VSLPRFLVPPGSLAGLGPGAGFALDGAEGRHAATVRRIRTGQRIDLTDGAGLVVHCSVISSSRERLDLRVDGVTRRPPPLVRLVLAQALAKGGRDEQAVETATEVGVDALVPWQADRSVVRWSGERGARARSRWQVIAREAAKQSRRAFVPLVENLVSTAGLADRCRCATLSVIMHESAKRPLLDVPLPLAGEVLVVVGPEGGISDPEVAALEAAGALAVRLGPEVLRASTAGPVALAWIAARSGRWA
jgi:16S rRNA (uracil1498-N3)-methyltransferase